MKTEPTQFSDSLSTHKLHIEMLKDINLANFPKERTHYLAYALQFGLKLPSVKTMDRCEGRNRKKAGTDKADEITGRVAVICQRPKRNNPFTITTRYGDKQVGNLRRFFRRGKKGKKGTKEKKTTYGPKRVFPVRNSISLPAEIFRRDKIKAKPKQRVKVFTVRSPQWNELRAERDRFRQEIEQYRKEAMIAEQKPIPEYFRKKKDNQRRRRKQRWDLINDNKDTLVNIFGDVVNKPGWPVGRRQIKLALGIDPDNDSEDNNMQAFGDLLEMAENHNKSKGKVRAKSTKPNISQGIASSKPSKKVHQDVSNSKGKNNRSLSKKK